MTTENLTTVGPEEVNNKVSLEALAKMTGFPVEMIMEEIFKGETTGSEVSLNELRSAMLSYIDATMMTDNQK